jgi:ribosomal protein S20
VRLTWRSRYENKVFTLERQLDLALKEGEAQRQKLLLAERALAAQQRKIDGLENDRVIAESSAQRQIDELDDRISALERGAGRTSLAISQRCDTR